MRLVVRSTAVGLVLLTAVGVLLETDPEGGGTWFTSLAFGVGAASVIVVGGLRRRPFRAADEPGLASAFVTRVVIGLAVAEIPGLVGFVGRLLSGEAWPLVIGAGYALLALRLIYPTEADIDRREAELHAAGSPLSLRRALGAAP